MEDVKRKEIRCPRCGTEFSYPVWNIIDVSRHPDMREKAADGTAFRTVCPRCGAPIILSYHFIYWDKENKILIAAAPDGKDPKEARIWIWDHAQTLSGYKTRIVYSLNSFMEKLMIWHAGLNDKLIELLKAAAWQQVQKKQKDAGIDEILFSLSSDHHPSFILRRQGKLATGLEIDEKVYHALEEAALPSIESSSEEDLVIDMKWAVQMMKKLN